MQYFLHARQRSDRAGIKTEWIEETIRDPIYTEIQTDGRIGKWNGFQKRISFLELFCWWMEKQFIMFSSIEILEALHNEGKIFS